MAPARADGLVVNPENIPLDWDGVWDARVTQTTTGWTGLTVNLNTLARRTSDFVTDDRALVGRTGIDVGYNVTPQSGGVATINTDFAETEVDTRQINLTQFPLFLPEKRAFFLEGSDQFTFGLNLSQDFVPFYSRTIGLVEGSIVPLKAGLKVLGRAGKRGIAALDVETGAAHDLSRRHLFASRVTYDATEHLRVGTLLTNGDPEFSTGNRFAGVDATWTTSTLFGDKNFAADAWAAASRSDGIRGRSNGWGAVFDYPMTYGTSPPRSKCSAMRSIPLSDSSRAQARDSTPSTLRKPRPQQSWIQQFFFDFRPQLMKDLEGRTLTWRVFTAPFNVASHSGVHLEVNYAPEFQRLTQPFTITDRVTIPAGEYHFNRFRVEGQSSPARPMRVGTTIWFGEFFAGHLTQVETFITWTQSSGRLQLQFDAENDFGRLPFGNFGFS